MRRKHAFIPTTLDRLESRVVLSRTPLGTPVVVSGLYPHQRILNLQHQSGAAEINQVFGSFQNDYDQARATYFASIQNQSNPSQATTNAFVLYTTQRVSLLGQQILNIFVQTKHGQSQSRVLKRLVATTIIGFRGTINVGTIVDQGDGVFSVTGNHTYMASGTYNINIQVVRIANGQTASTSSTALIGSPSPTFAFTGGLAPVPGNGPFISSGYATTNQPTFDGTAAAYAIVQLFARPLNVDAELPLGETVADSSGHWSLATGPLAAGGYVITAKVTPPAGYPSEMMALSSNHGTFFIDLSPAIASVNSQPAAVAAATTRHIGRSRTLHITAHRTSRTPRALVARSTPTEGPIRSSH